MKFITPAAAKFCLGVLVFTTLLPALAAETNSLPFVSPMFGDNMVLQCGKNIHIWGWAQAGEKISVGFAGEKKTTAADSSGRWEIILDPLKASSTPRTLTVTATDNQQLSIAARQFTNVLVGDVWLCGGQSNMELGLVRTHDGAQEIAAADHPEIRLFKVASHVAYSPAALVQGSWKICSPQTVAENGGFSAVAYFFGRKLNRDLSVPIGLVEDCLGGTPAESWMSAASLRPLKDFDAPLDEIQKLHAKGGPEYGSFLMHWLDENDIGNNLWSAENFDDSKWKSVQIPGGFADLGVADVPGICWFRREFTLPDPLPAGKAVLFLGSIEKMDTTYLNGQWVGASSWVENPRAYVIKDGVLKPGRNVIALRVFKMKTPGGFLGKADELRLVIGDKTNLQTVVPLAGEWRGALSVDARPPHPLPLTFENYPTMPSVLFDGMIEPVAPFSIRGAIWYQGEANFQRAHQYQTLLPLLIGDWRKVFQSGDFPFYIVSLPAFMTHRDKPGSDGWAELREAQALTAKNVKNTALAVTVDTGEADNIHPTEKKLVGERLALCALANTYGEKISYAGPTFVSMKKLPGALKLHFTHTDGGLITRSNQLEEFSVAGKDRKWFWANAKIEGENIIVSSSNVPEPVAARYAWQANPSATLYNGKGLPAVPFRTDDWPGVTDHSAPW